MISEWMIATGIIVFCLLVALVFWNRRSYRSSMETIGSKHVKHYTEMRDKITEAQLDVDEEEEEVETTGGSSVMSSLIGGVVMLVIVTVLMVNVILPTLKTTSSYSNISNDPFSATETAMFGLVTLAVVIGMVLFAFKSFGVTQ